MSLSFCEGRDSLLHRKLAKVDRSKEWQSSLNFPGIGEYVAPLSRGTRYGEFFFRFFKGEGSDSYLLYPIDFG